MTYQEKNTTVFLMNGILIFGYYVINVYQLVQENRFIPINVFSLWASVIVLGIIVTIIGVIVTQILFSIIHTIKTREEPTFVEDERDKLIELRGSKNSYNIFSIGVLISMVSLILGKPPLVMFNMLVISAFTADMFGNLSRLYLYRRGF